MKRFPFGYVILSAIWLGATLWIFQPAPVWRYITIVPSWAWVLLFLGFVLVGLAYEKLVLRASPTPSERPRQTLEWQVALGIWSIFLFPLLQEFVIKPFFRLRAGAEGRAELMLVYVGIGFLVVFIGNKWGRIKPVVEVTDTRSERG